MATTIPWKTTICMTQNIIKKLLANIVTKENEVTSKEEEWKEKSSHQ